MGTPYHHQPPHVNSDSFMALLDLPTSEAMELLLPSGSIPEKPYVFPLVKDKVPTESDCPNPNPSAVLDGDAAAGRTAGCKRKDADRKGKGSAKKKKSDSSPDGEARREKINARMKLLQELVLGCHKISGTALVLDEIINHVQSLQQQVEVLSMKLAAVNSCVDFKIDACAHDALAEFQPNINSEENYQQWPLDSIHQPVLPKEESHSIHTLEVSFL